jgi:CubicO group peptidase (beta-lactamase class C family)
MLDDGRWQGRQVLPPGWLDLAATRALPDGEGSGYGAQTWIPGDPVGGECRDTPGVPQDTLSMEGHWGQLVAMIPSQNAVIVRLGWTFESDQFDACRFIADVAAALPPAS